MRRCLTFCLYWIALGGMAEILFHVNVVDLCGRTLHADAAIVNSHRHAGNFHFVAEATDCALTLRAASTRDRVQFRFRSFLVYGLLRAASPAPSTSDPCRAGSYIRFYDGPDASWPPLGPPLCGRSPPRPLLAAADQLTLRLVTRGSQPRVDFAGDFASIRPGSNRSDCRGDAHFLCRNGKCIPSSIACDDHCGDGSDLETCGGQRSASRQAATAATAGPTEGRSQSPARQRDKGSAPLLLFYVLIGGSAAALLLCWSPGWLLWRLGPCRRGVEALRLAKVTPTGDAQ